MIDVRTAVKAAQDYLQSIQDMLGLLENVRLEEVELSRDQNAWMITLGFDRSGKPDLFGNTPKYREYKLFKIDAENGQVESMKIREV